LPASARAVKARPTLPAAPGSEAPRTAATVPAAPTAPSAQATRANQLRLQALEHLNGGNADRAVALLQEAQRLDAASPTIQRDLNRALRVQAALRGG
jgi:hypothetical protein